MAVPGYQEAEELSSLLALVRTSPPGSGRGATWERWGTLGAAHGALWRHAEPGTTLGTLLTAERTWPTCHKIIYCL